MNIPNILTLLRIVLTPAVVIFLMEGSYFKALIVFSISGLTDGLDGFLARVLKQQTKLGAYLDPIADKALLTSSFLTLAIMGIIPGWLTVIVISRDCIILLGIAILSIMSISFEIRPAFISKVTTMLQLMTVLTVLVLQGLGNAMDYNWMHLLYWVTALFTILSGLGYLVRGIRLINTQG
ncbi:CDP-alcohol phosphatidyltransferase family protein [Syntrophus aciditrophicus]|uniref:CDP-diacylglycerol--glycerol-3-phosphate 3-phosphatidyltransferase n=1 Tax=Syntrophus aciditrophicus (strain SB) TaxID=56780 RepID=Q2LR23_SYNAS|nr:CDP-alcohol phosphatidyltransferase family protein [Syntrophus aciditrophicus]ABC76530.1 CDP-diacylglycerol--glycerol-3-phosphate 3-phosphatidyltransferase [Syntrophus aciditrophicus SB]